VAVTACALAAWLLAASGPAPPPGLAAEIVRLGGHTVELTPDGGYRIADIAGEGEPFVGVVERRDAALYLVTGPGPAMRLIGPLTKPRIAGPGYKVWALGPVSGSASAPVLRPRRLGVLAPPRRVAD
jgi:hypothetical protein